MNITGINVYVYCFMQKMDINFRYVLFTKDDGCLKHLKMNLVEKRDQWETVLLNVKHVLRSAESFGLHAWTGTGVS